MHKIRIIKLKDPTDIGVLNLTKAFAVRKRTSTANKKEAVALAIYFPGAPEMIFPQTAFKFEFVEIAMDGVVHYSPADIDKIVATFTMLD